MSDNPQYISRSRGRQGRSCRTGRASADEAKRRANKIIELLNMGNATQDIIHYAARNWQIGERQCKEYIARARKEISALLDIERDEHLTLIFSRYDTIYKKAMRADDYRSAISALGSMLNMIEKHTIHPADPIKPLFRSKFFN